MKELNAYFFGIFPRSEKLIDITRKKQNYHEDLMQESLKMIEYQKSKNFKIISDPQIAWEDMFRPLALSAEGITINGLNRYFETNTFYKVPVVRSKPSVKEGVLKNYLTTGASLISFPDPFTFSCLSKDEFYGDKEKFIEGIGNLMATFASQISKEGYRYLILKGPSYGNCEFRNYEKSIKSALSIIKDSFKGKVIIHVYFYRNLSALNFLASSPVDGIGVDMYSYKTDDIKGLVNSGKELALGIINGFNTKMENEDHIINVIRSLNFNGPLYITNNVDFEFLPQKFALEKLDLISKIAGEIS